MKVEKWKSQHPPLLHISFPFALQGLNEEGEKKEKGGGGGHQDILLITKEPPNQKSSLSICLAQSAIASNVLSWSDLVLKGGSLWQLIMM